MRKRLYIFILSITLPFVVMCAESRIGAHVTPCVTWQMDKTIQSHGQLGAGTTAGFVYQYQYKNFIVQTGIDIGFAQMRHGKDSMFIGTDTLLTQRIDKMNKTICAIPVMIGFDVNHFYTLLGAKLLLPSQVVSYQDAFMSMRNDEDKYHEDYNTAFMDPHPVTGTSTMILDIDVHACLELGYRVPIYAYGTRKRMTMMLQVGAFVEYGLLNTHPIAHQTQHTDAAAQMILMPMVTEKISTTRKVECSNIEAGIRVALLFDVTKRKHGCNCFVR